MSSLAVIFDAPGDPEKVLAIREVEAAPPKDDEVSVRFLLAPINPSDINTIEGKYPLMPPLPGTPGHEGVGQVTAVGAKVSSLKPGDLVVPLEPCMGTWRQAATCTASALHRVPPDVPLEALATLCINPPSALGMLENFVNLQPGDVVVQNGATSAVGQEVIQLARSKGVRTVNIIRERPNWEETVSWLRALGADVVSTEARAKQDLKEAGLPEPVLGLNCVGGSAATTVAKLLREGGTMLTYGGMSMKPVQLPTSLLIFKDITFKGFWLSGRSSRQGGPAARAAVLDRLVDLIRQGQLKTAPTKEFPLSQVQDALQYYATPFRPNKVLLRM